MAELIPVVLFSYIRPHYLRQTLACLKENNVPLIYAYSDGPRTPDLEPQVQEVRRILREIDWCDLVLCEREHNLGLGNSIRTGVAEVFEKHEAIIVYEDDLICVPGTYQYMSAAMQHYWHDPQVMSVTGWTHPRVTPKSVGAQPYFDGRTECLVWGAWRRSWVGMDKPANELVAECESREIDVFRYGSDLYYMAMEEERRNIWAVRWSYHHILNHGLCLRPPHSMVEHIGLGEGATNTPVDVGFTNPSLLPAPSIPNVWPEVVEHSDCAALWQIACGSRPNLYDKGRRIAIKAVKPLFARFKKL